MNDFTHLHIHTSMGSTLDGYGTTDDYCSYAQELGFTSLGISNHGTADDFINFQNSAKKHGITPLFGVEYYIVEDLFVKTKGESRDHILAFAKNEVGYNNLLKLVTISNLEGFFYRPRIDAKTLLEHSEGLVITSGCSVTPLHKGYGKKLFENLIDKQKEDIYLELMPHELKDSIATNILCLELSKKYGLKNISTVDAHYCRRSDAIFQEVMLAIGTQKRWEDPERFKFSTNEFYLKSSREMIRAFVGQGILSRDEIHDAMSNTCEIVEKCSDFKWIKEKEMDLPKIESIGAESDSGYLERICWEEMKIRGFIEKEEYRERLKEELELIQNKKFERYFLIIKDLLDWARSEGIALGPGRGSGPSSLVVFLLNITQIDPIKHKLLFFRFLSPDRVSLPDLDLDVCALNRHRIRARLEELYGKYNVASISTFSVLRGRGAIRDCARVFSVPLTDVAKACSVVEKKVGDDEGNDHTIEEAMSSTEDGRNFSKKYPDVVRYSIAIENQYRNKGTHAAALVVANNDLRDGTRCALVLGKEKENVINWNKDDSEHQGLLKIDILSLKMVTVLDYSKKLVKLNCGEEIDFEKISLEDQKIYSEISKGNTTGAFQLGSSNIKKFCKQMGVDNFDNLVALSAIHRPGPMISGATESYVRRKNGLEDIPFHNDILSDITKNTYGTIIFQEDLMLVMNRLAGMSWQKVDKVRKLVAKSRGADSLRAYEKEFVDGCVNQKTLREDQATLLWNDLVGFGQYAFNLSHSCAYSYLTVWGMFMKIYHPIEYIVALLTYGTDNEDMRDEYIEEAFRLKIDVRPPKVGISSATEFKIHDKKIYLPFSSIRGVGDKTAVGFEKLGKKKGFIEGKEPVSKRFLNILEKIGAYEDKALTDEEADEVSQYLGISLVRNKLYKYKKLIKLIDKDLGFSKVKDINLHEPESQDKYYFGLITELNLSVKKGKESKFTAANASFKDETGSCKISFAKEFYDAFPSEIEHCEGEIILLQANTSKRAGSVRVEKAWFQEDLLSAEFGDLGLNILETKRFQNYAVENCEECDLCKKDMIPRVPKSGRYNVMVIGETGIDIGYDFLRELKKNDIKERDLNFSSFIKCPLKSAKEVARKHVEACSTWLEEEIKEIGPCLILGIGNTAVKFFTEEDTGINNLNGTTVWNEKYGCYVAFCTSPSTLYYGGNNIVQFQDGVKNFCEKAKNMGLGLF